MTKRLKLMKKEPISPAKFNACHQIKILSYHYHDANTPEKEQYYAYRIRNIIDYYLMSCILYEFEAYDLIRKYDLEEIYPIP